MDNIDDRAGPSCFQILQENASVATIRVWRVDAFCGEVIELFEVGVPCGIVVSSGGLTRKGQSLHYDFLLVGILERLGSPDSVFTFSTY